MAQLSPPPWAPGQLPDRELSYPRSAGRACGPGAERRGHGRWAIAWAGSKPFASLVDGTLGSWIGPQWTGLILAAPALIPLLVIMLEPGSASGSLIAGRPSTVLALI